MPLGSDMNINRLVSNWSRAYQNDNYVANKVLPPVSVKKEQGKYARYNKDNFRTGGIDLLSTEKQIAKTATYGVDTDSYTTALYRVKDIVGVLEQQNADQPFSPLRDATENLMDLMATDKEAKMVAQVLASGNYASGSKVAVSTQWNNYNTATGVLGPVKRVHSALNTIRGLVAKRANVMLVGADVHTVLIDSPDLTSRIKFVQQVTVGNVENAMAAIFGVQEYHIVDAIKNTAFQGGTDSLSDMVTDKAALLYRPARQTLKSVAHSVQFQLAGFPNGARWVDEERMNGTVIEVRDNYVFKLVDNTAGFLFDDVLA